MTTDLHIIGFNHATAPVALRERVAKQVTDRRNILDELSVFLEEVVVLNTCNRAEFIYRPIDDLSHSRTEAFIRDIGGLSAKEYADHSYHYQGMEAVRHLYRVAAGLDSMVTGETQILGQLKVAFERAMAGGHAGSHLRRIYGQTLNAARAVRREFALNNGSVSISSLAVMLARKVFSDLDSQTVLLVGAGEMGKQACVYFSDAGTRTCALACRHCRAEAMDIKDPRELNLDEARNLIDDIAAMGTPLIVFSGGDPLRRGDLNDLIRYAKGVGLRVGTIPATTSRLTIDRVRRLKDAGLDQGQGDSFEWHLDKDDSGLRITVGGIR